MYIQEIEDRDYWPQTELQNAYALSRQEFQDDKAAIQELRSLGRYVIVAKAPAYCPRTDAILGERWVMLGDFATPDDAEMEANGIRAEWENEEVSVEVMGPPRLPLPIVLPPAVDTDEIPF